MAKRLFDVGVSTAVLIICLPLFLLTAIGIKLTSPGPVYYRAKRVGLNGKLFVMHKFRSMHVQQDHRRTLITAVKDDRVFPLGKWLRRLKIDELPQLYDVLRGEMSIVGPRPEDPDIVKRHYSEEQLATLRVRPGLTSPGSLYNYTHGHLYLSDHDVEKTYAEKLLPVKLSLEHVYVNQARILYDLAIIARTVWVIANMACGRKHFQNPPEMRKTTSGSLQISG